MPIPPNPMSYTSRTFNEIYLELKTKYPTVPDWFVINLAGLFDVGHWYLDARAQNVNLLTAYTEEAVRDLCATLDYFPNNKSPGGGQFHVTIPTGSAPLVIPKADLIWEVINSSGQAVRFEAFNDLTITTGNSGQVPVLEGTTIVNVEIGISDGATEFQQFVILDNTALPETVTLDINGDTWTRQDTLANSSPTDKHFRTINRPNNITVVEFGNGTLGAIPGAFSIFASYRSGGGIVGNIKFTSSVVSGEAVGTSDGSASQVFALANKDAITETLVIKVNGIVWDPVDSFGSSFPTDQHYVVSFLDDGTIEITFGDGTNGKVPPNTQAITADYTRADLVAATYIGGNADILSSYPLGDFSGGKDKEELEKSRRLAPIMLRTNYRAVTEEDYRVLSEKFSAAIIQAKSLPGYYGAGTVGVHIVPAGGGDPSPALKTALQDYLIPRSTLSTQDVRVRDPNYVTQNISAGIKMRSGYSFPTYQQYATLAARLVVSEVTREVTDVYLEEGIASAVTVINSVWGYTFGNADYSEITRILTKRIRGDIPTWGTEVIVNEIIAVLDDLTGVNYAEVYTPATNISIAFDQITTSGTVGVVQVF